MNLARPARDNKTMCQAQSVTFGWDLSDGIQPYALIASMSTLISDIVPFSWYDDKLKGPAGQVPGCLRWSSSP